MIRPARPEDAAQICAFWNPVIRDTVVTFSPTEKSEQDVKDMILGRPAGGYAFVVAEDAGEILGFATYSQFRGGLGYAKAMEHTIILAPAAWGRGVGRALMTAIEDDARARGYHTMVAAVSGGNPAGIAFHAAVGYDHVGHMPESGYKFGKYWDLVLMQKILA